MSDKTFLLELDKLLAGQGDDRTKIHRAVVSAEASYSNKAESFEVIVIKIYQKGFKIQWCELGSNGQRPKLPSLKPEVSEKIAAALKNSTTFLTSGYGLTSFGMEDAATVLKCINILAKYGISIQL